MCRRFLYIIYVRNHWQNIIVFFRFISLLCDFWSISLLCDFLVLDPRYSYYYKIIEFFQTYRTKKVCQNKIIKLNIYTKKNRITIRYLSLSHIHGDEGDNVGVPNMNSIQDICKTNNSQKFTINWINTYLKNEK